MRIDAVMDKESLLKLQKALSRYPVECANGIVSAINKSMKSVDVEMQRAITKEYNVTKSDLNGGGAFKNASSRNLIKEHKANYANLNASIEVRGSRMNTGARFLSRPKNPVSHKGKTMRQIRKIKYPVVMIRRGTKKPLAAFVAYGKGTSRGVFVRDRGKLKMQKSLSTAEMASNEKVWKSTSDKAQSVLNDKVEQELNYRLGKLKGK